MIVKIKIKKNLMHFNPVTRVSDDSRAPQNTCLDNFSLADFIYPIPFFSRIVWIDKLHDLMERFFPKKGTHRNRIKTFFQLSWQRLLRGKMLHQKHESYGYILPMKKLS